MTLLEMMITLAVIGLMTLIGYLGITHVRKTSLRQDATQVGAMLRATANMAIMSGTHHRLVFDLEEQTIRIEVCEGKVTLRRTEREEEPDPEDAEKLKRKLTDGTIPQEILDALTPEEAAKAAQALAGTRIGTARCGPPTLSNGDADGRGDQRKMRTDDGVKIRRVFVQHLKEPQLDGIVTINFFPMGYAEKAVIEIADEDGDQYTLLVHGLTGRVEFLDEEVDPDDHMMRDPTGKKVDVR